MTVGLVLGICGYILHCFVVEELSYFAIWMMHVM